ncbi:unnamed protein product [Protopolystoma xenopodis]|uniref:Uncharacterized protein n=1 Tax=Protopolystoma xenopodis TaxID=117903 RepID=A0A448WFT9_9PLAT|nr:unnamed protein product [Protopolystoma xenopodis]
MVLSDQIAKTGRHAIKFTTILPLDSFESVLSGVLRIVAQHNGPFVWLPSTAIGSNSVASLPVTAHLAPEISPLSSNSSSSSTSAFLTGPLGSGATSLSPSQEVGLGHSNGVG